VSQIFFSLTLGFGVMTAYASYLPRDSDQFNNGLVTACLNCSFEFIAGLAIFSILFSFAIVPQASTIAMMFFVVPKGIGQLPVGVTLFGLLFFLLLLMAGLSSSISLIEGLTCAMIDKFRWSRKRTLAVAGAVGMVGSLLFAYPMVVDAQLAGNGTLGLSLLDLVDHWAFSHGLLLVGLVECLIIGWLLPVSRLREELSRRSRLPLPVAFDWLIKLVIPAALVYILGTSVWSKVTGGIYGATMALDRFTSLPVLAFLAWFAITAGAALWLTFRNPSEPAEQEAGAFEGAGGVESSGA
jgi:NSS family neurotransmitter:Na+ symporter